MNRLQKIADEFNVAVVITNQVSHLLRHACPLSARMLRLLAARRRRSWRTRAA